MDNNHLVTIDPVSDSRWDPFVEKHPFGWIVHLSQWKTVLEKSFSHMRGHYLALVDSATNEIRAALPLFEVRSWLIGNRLVCIPYATLCDPLVNTAEEMVKLFEGALNLSNRLKTSHVEIRTFHAPSLIPDSRWACDRHYKHHYLKLDQDPETLKKSFHRTNIRQRIQRALDSHIVIKRAESEADLITFFSLHKKTRKKLCLPPQPYLFFKALWETLNPLNYVTLHLAEHDGTAIAGLILFKFGNRVSAEFLASDEEYLNMSPNHLLFWEAIKSAYEEGYAVFDFGRTSSDNESLMTFKHRWGTQVLDIPQFYYLLTTSEKCYERETSIAYKLTQKLCRHCPDTVFDLIGSFCYRHLG